MQSVIATSVVRKCITPKNERKRWVPLTGRALLPKPVPQAGMVIEVIMHARRVGFTV